MDRLMFARGQMATSLAFHIAFAAIGIALPLAMFVVEGLFVFTRRRHYRRLAHTWAKATGLLFAIGAVSGTALSFELGLLWPKYMEMLGAAVGHAFALEGFAFFIEAIFIGLYLYGGKRLTPVARWLCAGVIAFTGLVSGALVLAVNAWMQLPIGFTLDAAGKVISTDPIAIYRTYAWVSMSVHSSLACYTAIPLLAAGVYALAWLRGRRDAYCRTAILVCMSIAGVAAILQPLSGDLLAKFVYRTQPAKFAAMESHFKTMTHAPLHIGGIPDIEERRNRGAIEIPGGLSFLAAHDFNAKVIGLDDIPRDEWPNVVITHIAFDVMVACGTLIAIVMVIFWILYWRGRVRVLENRLLLRTIVVISPLGLVALESGWVVTELGRQPWIIQGVMRTKDAVSPTGNMGAVFIVFSLLYIALGVMTIVLLRRLARESAAMENRS